VKSSLKRDPSKHFTFALSKSIHFLICAIAFSCLCGAAQAQTTAEEFIKRGKELLEQKQYYAAGQAFETAVKLDPSSAEAYCFRGKLQLDRAKGTDDLSKAIELKPDYADAYYERGLNNDLANDQVSALRDYNKAIELNSRLFDAYRTRAVLYLLQRKDALAIADYTKMIELKPDGESYYMRGNSYLEIGQDAIAIVDLTRSIQLDPTYYWSYMQRAKAYRHLNNFKLAQADERKAAQIGPPKID
jgi:tetratricopeptide (TPR) repeat protein